MEGSFFTLCLSQVFLNSPEKVRRQLHAADALEPDGAGKSWEESEIFRASWYIDLAAGCSPEIHLVYVGAKVHGFS